MNKNRVALVAIALLLGACSPDDGGESSTTTTSSTSTTTSTTEPTTTTTTALTVTTTTAATTTSTTITTTTLLDATVELTDEGIQAGSIWLPFGHDDDETVATLMSIFGPPSSDSGWVDSITEGGAQFGVCPSPHVRGVSWGDAGTVSLQLLFTDSDTDFWTGGVEHFFTFYYSDSADPMGLTTPEGIGVGSSLGELKTAYDPAKIIIDEAFFDPGLGFWSYDLQPYTGLWGFATGQGDADTITSLNGGQGCGE